MRSYKYLILYIKTRVNFNKKIIILSDPLIRLFLISKNNFKMTDILRIIFPDSFADNLNLTTGNAGNILVLINGNAKGKVGKKGEVIDSLVISSDFNN